MRALVTMHNVRLTLGGKALFQDLSLQIRSGDRIGLIGRNGAGKSSLLRLLGGDLEHDKGDFSVGRGVQVGHLTQDIEPPTKVGLLEFMRAAAPERSALNIQAEAVEAELAAHPSEARVMQLAEELAHVHERLGDFDARFGDHIALRILAGLGFTEADGVRPLGEFSGGWRMRAVLGALLFSLPDLLLLDEPTNHLDVPTTMWLSSFLSAYKGAFVLISHDRDFLNEQIKKVLTFEAEGLRTYDGNFDDYRKQREVEQEVLIRRAANLAREREKTEAFISRFRYQATKAKAVQSRIKSLEKQDDIIRIQDDADTKGLTFRFAPTTRTGKDVIVGEQISRHFGALQVFNNVDLRVRAQSRIGIVGINGAGKTTLLKVLAQELQPTSGRVHYGANVNIAYYAQHHAEALHETNTVLEEIAAVAKDKTSTALRGLLGSLLFSGDDVDKRIAVLSGGERARVALAKMLLSGANVLLMDEPTNHLDIYASEHLAAALASFDGTLLFVSHNRSFQRNLATSIWNVQDSQVEVFPGTFDEYTTSAIRTLEIFGERARTESAKKAGDGLTRKERKRREAELRQFKSKVLGPKKKMLNALEERIAALEEEQTERSAQLSDADVYADTTLRDSLLSSFEEAKSTLERLNDNWEDVAEEVEKAEAECILMAAAQS